MPFLDVGSRFLETRAEVVAALLDQLRSGRDESGHGIARLESAAEVQSGP